MIYDDKLKAYTYSPGDVVTVVKIPYPSYKNVSKSCGGTLAWHPSMADYCGRAVTINKVLPDGEYKIKEDNGVWYWCDEFFEKENIFNNDEDDEGVFDIDTDDFLSSFIVRS